MTKDKKISVVIPTFNRPQFIKYSIDSCLRQQGVIVEIIVVDDNGRGTEAQKLNEIVLREYIIDNRIMYLIHETNKNGSAARNTGIANASGNYIAFLDDDDWFEEGKLERQINLIERERSVGALCGYRRVYKNGIMIVGMPKFPEDYEQLKCMLLSHSIDTCAGSTLVVKKEIVDCLNGYDETFLRHQDLEFLYRLVCKGRISVCEEVLG